MDCQECAELSGAYALGALTLTEKQQVDEHLVSCPSCQELYTELQSTAALLPLAVEPVAHSPLQKERLLQRIQASEGTSSQTSWNKQRSRQTYTQRTRLTPLLSIAAAFLLVLLGGMTIWNISLQQQLASIQSAPIKFYAVKGSSTTHNISGEVVSLPQRGETMLILRGLPKLEGNRIYQGWLLKKEQPTSIGVLETQQQDVATLRFNDDISNYDAIAVSLEPGPQASKDAPQGAVIALGSLSGSGTTTLHHLTSTSAAITLQRKRDGDDTTI